MGIGKCGNFFTSAFLETGEKFMRLKYNLNEQNGKKNYMRKTYL